MINIDNIDDTMFDTRNELMVFNVSIKLIRLPFWLKYSLNLDQR